MRNTILIQGAMDEEIHYLIDKVNNKKKTVIGPWEFYEGQLNGENVVVYKTFIGMVNAAASSALAIERFKPIAIINQGTAGSHSKDIKKNDIVIGEKILNIGAFETISKERGGGCDLLNWKPLSIECADVRQNKSSYVTKFQSNEILVNEFYKLRSNYSFGNIYKGGIGSADLWNKEIDRIDWFNSKFGTLAEEMEAAAVAQLCTTYDIPFLSIRIISNNEMYNDTFDTGVAINLQKFIEENLEVVNWKRLRSV